MSLLTKLSIFKNINIDQLCMNPIDYTLKKYEQINRVTQDELVKMQENRKIVLFFNLVVDYDGFDHPGFNQTLQTHRNQQISGVYSSKNHSQVANLMLCHRTIAKRSDSQYEPQGKAFYNKVAYSDMNTKHEKLMGKMNFKAPILQQINSLSVDQLQILTAIPKLFKNPQQIKWKKGKFESFVFEQHFWLSFAYYWTVTLSILCWVLLYNESEDIVTRMPLFALGVVAWTAVEYYFHRVLLHVEISERTALNGHQLHHAFPNLNNKVAISIGSNTRKISLIALVLLVFLDKLSTAMLMLGLVFSLVNYDSIHYYCHFGPQINLRWLKYLRINHLKHHYRDQTRYFGVTNTVWDSIFGTGAPSIKQKQ